MAIQIIIKGDVHGVFFRAFVEETALKLNIKGFVRNMPEGVEVVAEGSEKALSELVKACQKGPLGAVINGVQVTKTMDKGFKSFEIKYDRFI